MSSQVITVVTTYLTRFHGKVKAVCSWNMRFLCVVL
jgi:hypothetical protein